MGGGQDSSNPYANAEYSSNNTQAQTYQPAMPTLPTMASGGGGYQYGARNFPSSSSGSVQQIPAFQDGMPEYMGQDSSVDSQILGANAGGGGSGQVTYQTPSLGTPIGTNYPGYDAYFNSPYLDSMAASMNLLPPGTNPGFTGTSPYFVNNGTPAYFMNNQMAMKPQGYAEGGLVSLKR